MLRKWSFVYVQAQGFFILYMSRPAVNVNVPAGTYLTCAWSEIFQALCLLRLNFSCLANTLHSEVQEFDEGTLLFTITQVKFWFGWRAGLIEELC